MQLSSSSSAMLRPKVAIGLAVSIVLVIVLLGGLHHGGHITLPLEKVKEAASDVIGWEDIEMPHNEFTPEMTEETPEIPELEESSGPDVRNETSSQAADFLEDPSVLESAESPPLSTPTSTDLSNAEPEQELPQQTSAASLSASSLDVNPIDDSAVRIYIGVVTAWWSFAPRSLLREAYKHFTLDARDTVTLRFVLGKPASHDSMFTPMLQWENDTFGDIHMIDMEENMNEGKSYEYFASMAAMYPNGGNVSREERKWDYVMKVDDDTFLHLPNLVEKLRPMKREKTWFGRGWKPEYYMFGPGYLLSWDLVTWLSDNRANLKQFMVHMAEDRCISEIMKWGGKAEETWQEMDEWEYTDYPDSKAQWAAPLDGERGILVHRLKDLKWLAKTIGCFTGSGSCR